MTRAKGHGVDIQTIIVIIVLFIFADIVFYMVIMKGLLFTSIMGPTPAEQARAAKEPTFALELHHSYAHPEAGLRTGSGYGQSADGNLAEEQFFDFAAVVRQELQNLNLENIRFTPAYELRVSVPRRLEMVLTQDILTSVTRAFNMALPAKISALRIRALLKASLTASGSCRVVALNDEQQRISGSGTLTWAWEVTPLKAGFRELGFDLELNLKTADSDEKRTYSWRGGEVLIASNIFFTFKTFCNRHWPSVLVGVAAAAGVMYMLWQRA
jgi:hypothetical protein